MSVAVNGGAIETLECLVVGASLQKANQEYRSSALRPINSTVIPATLSSQQAAFAIAPQLHEWGAHEHPSLMSPDHAQPGNGLPPVFPCR